MLQWICKCRCPPHILISSSLAIYQEVELLDHMVVLFLVFLRNIYTIFHKMVELIYILTNSVQKVPFPSHPHQHLLPLVFFDKSHSNTCEVISYCGLPQLPWLLVMLSIFSHPGWPFVCLFEKYLLRTFACFKITCLLIYHKHYPHKYRFTLPFLIATKE
jgi:hypothetical protein